MGLCPIIFNLKRMDKILKIEEIGQFILSIVLFSLLNYHWWIFPLLILTPDVSMVGYLINTKIGALLYNIFHHKFIAIMVMLGGFISNVNIFILIGLIMFGHSAMDRIFGYGLKYTDSFKHTHLGWIGNNIK